jgi:Rho guanine nucleotide exchange factor 12
MFYFIFSDPEPDEIKNAIHSSQELNKNLFESNLAEDSLNSFNSNSAYNSSTQQSNNNTSFSTRTPISQVFSNLSTPTQTSSSLFGLTSSSSFVANNSTSLASANRHTWMTNDSDMEVDEELPNLSANIEKEVLTRLDKKQIKIQEVINELIHTEQKHVRNLKIMKYHFYIPIKVEMYLTDEERNLLFPNLDEILDLHSSFNNKLKELRKENTIVPLKQLIDIILDQFEGETGYKFKTACAKFCQNQGEAMKLLQNKIKHDKFSLFLSVSISILKFLIL